MREEIASIVGYELSDPKIQAVTVTDVQVSENLRDAKVFVVVDGNERETLTALKALKHAAPFIRQEVSQNLSLRYPPHLHFVRDTVEEKGMRVDQLLADLRQENKTLERAEEAEAEHLS